MTAVSQVFYSVDYLRGQAAGVEGPALPFPRFPCHPWDPLAGVYVLVGEVHRQAAAYMRDWWVKPQELLSGRAVLEYESRHDALLATFRWWAWAIILSPVLRVREPSSRRAAACLCDLAARLASGNPKLSADEIRELIGYAQSLGTNRSVHFPAIAFIAALEFRSRRDALPAEAFSTLRSLESDQIGTNNSIFKSSLKRIGTIMERANTKTPAADRAGATAADAIIETLLREAWPEQEHSYGIREIRGLPVLTGIRKLPPEALGQLLLAAIARIERVLPVASMHDGGPARRAAYLEEAILWSLVAEALRLPLPVDVIDKLAVWSNGVMPTSFRADAAAAALLSAIEHHTKSSRPTPAMTEWLLNLADHWASQHKPNHKSIARARALAGLEPQLELEPGEAWSDAAIEGITRLGDAQRSAWFSLIAHAKQGSGAAPSAKWLREARTLADTIGPDQFAASLVRWFPLVDRPRTRERASRSQYEPDPTNLIIDAHMEVLKGLCWLSGQYRSPDLARALGRLAISAYRKVPGIGPRATKVGNAAVYALGQMPGPDALGQLAMLRIKVKFGTAQKGIEKALAAAAARGGLPRDEIEELGVPTYGLTAVGLRHEPLGDYTAELAITGIGSAELRFTKNAPGKSGKPQKSIPAALKESHPEDLKDLKAAAKDIAAMLPAQRDRLDSLFLEDKSWPIATWRERYLDHPLIGILARRLIWTAERRGAVSISFSTLDTPDNTSTLVDHAGAPVTLPDDPDARIRLWHPITAAREEILAWRRFFEDRQLRQPFKQAHREVYLLTDAERNSGTYSNRFAAHIIRQHQFHALAAARGWKNRLRLMVDDEYPPAHRPLTAWGLRAEFWIEGIGDEYGTHTNESGAFLHLATDQVRFYRLEAVLPSAHASGGGYGAEWGRGDLAHGLPLDQVPPLVLSEIMRDVDLFVGVASVGNNPQWNDGGPGGAHRDYWWTYSFGELSESGAGRRDILQRLIPRLRIAAVCSFDGHFLVVRGRLRTYRIHLGSGNILMEPNSQYLCIVPGRGDSATDVFLPFEGDRTLSIILSKAFMLAEDDRIADETITRQIAVR